MGSQIAAINTIGRGNTRNTFTLSNGNCIFVGLESGGVVKVYETSAADRKTGWTQRASVTVTSLLTQYQTDVSAALFSDNSLGIIVKGQLTDGSIRVIYFKMTYSGYSVSALETVTTVLGSGSVLSNTAAEVDVSDNGTVAVAFVYTSSYDSVLRVKVRNTANTWGADLNTTVATGGLDKAFPSVSILNLAASGATRRLVVVAGAPWLDSSIFGTDPGYVVYTTTYNETSGTVTALTERARYLANYTQIETTGTHNAKLFPGNAANEYHLGMVLGSYLVTNVTPTFSTVHNCYYARGSWDGTTWTELWSPSVVQIWQNTGVSYGANGSTIGMTCGSGSISFNIVQFSNSGYGDPNWASNTNVCAMAQIVWSSNTGSAGAVLGYSNTWLDARSSAYTVFSGGTRNLSTNKHDIVFSKTDFKPYHVMAPTLPVPTSVSPDNGQSVVTGSPQLTAVTAFSEAYWPPSKWKAQWQISQDPAFVTGVRDYEMAQATHLGFTGVEGSNSTPKSLTQKTVQDNPSISVPPYGTPYYPLLSAGSWYIRARIEDTLGNQGAWTSTTRLFTIGHPPVAVPTSPLNNAVYEYGASGTKSFVWNFTDSSSSDTQTAYQLRIRTGDALGTVVYDSGKVSSTLQSATVNIPIGNKNQTLYWEVRLWDTDDAAGIYSTGSTFFQMVDPATGSITAPTAGQVLSGGTMTLNGVVAATGARVVKQYQYQIFSAGVVVWSSGVVLGTFANAATLPYIIPSGVLNNNTQYSVRLTVIDNSGIMSQSSFVLFSTSWTAALSATVFSADASQYNNLGYVRLSWTDANREAGFVGWNVYRKADIVDPTIGVTLSSGTYELVYQDYRATSGTYTWDDYYAPSNHRVSYLIKQLVDRGGFFVESQNTSAATATPVTDGYWLLEKTVTGGVNAYKIPLVIADEFADEQEEAEYNVIGRGRHVDKGDYLGPKGSLTVQLRDNVAPLTITPTFNGTFDVDITGWSAGGPNTVISRNTSIKFAGAASLAATCQAGYDSVDVVSDSMTAYPGKEHTVSAQLRGVGTNILRINWLDSTGTFISSDQNNGNGAAFQLITVVATAPMNATTLKISTAHQSMSAGVVAYVDSVTLSIASATGYTARQRRLALLAYQKSSAVMFLRNPFGDLFKVNISGMSVGRLSGVGVNEFCDVTLPYSKVG